MEPTRFDTLARTLTAPGSRRRALALALSGALGIFGLSQSDDAAAGGKCKPKCKECKKCKKGKNGKRGKCKPKANGTACSVGTCQSGNCVAPPPPPSCPGQVTCPAGFNPTCCPPTFPGCCSPTQGNGCCPAAFPLCCALTSEAECCAANEACCPAGTGPLFGCCPQDSDVCCVDPDAGNGGCCLDSHPNCCGVDEGGGCCRADVPVCCVPTMAVPEGACCVSALDCCDIDTDCDVEVGETCQDGCCALPGSGALTASSERKRSRQVPDAEQSRDARHTTSRTRAERFRQSAE